METLLEKRGVASGKERDVFLNPDYERDTHDPALLADMDKAVERILTAIESDEHIAIYADFDCDGIPGAVILHDFFKKIGFDNFEVYIPHRHNEGYGFHTEAIDTLKKRGTDLIITVDVGTVAVEAVAHAKELSMDVIITDHHELNGELPEAIAVVNPKREGYPFPDLCGAAVAFKLVQVLLARGRDRGLSAGRGTAQAGEAWARDIPDGWEKWLLDMVGIATVADMVPLVGENRVLARFGLTVLRKSSRPGLVTLLQKNRVHQGELTEDDIGFVIAPRINAASRMDKPELAFKMLTAQDPLEAENYVRELESLNRKRKGTVASLVKEAKQRAIERSLAEQPVTVLGDPDWPPALLGLAANSLMESCGGAVCLWGRDGAGALKGSCRSDGSINIVDMCMRAADALEAYGGHECAGGFSVSHEAVHTLSETLNRAAAAGETRESNTPESGTYDAVVPVEGISWQLWETLAQLAPFGIGNPKPIFRISSANIADVRLFGREQNHTEVTLRGESGTSVRGFQFFRTPESFSIPLTPGTHASVLAHLERDTFRGRRAVALRVIDAHD